MPRTTSIASLEKALAAKTAQLRNLQTRKGKLLAQVAKLDKQIAALAGGSVTPPLKAAAPAKVRRKRPRNEKPLMAFVIDVLSRSKEPMTAKEMAEAVTAAGYRTMSKNLQQLIWSQIYKDDRIEKAARGKFVVKRAKPKRKGKK